MLQNSSRFGPLQGLDAVSIQARVVLRVVAQALAFVACAVIVGEE